MGPPPTGNPADISNYLPSRAELIDGQRLFSFAAYDRANKLPYTINYAFDIQWQPRNDLAIDIGYVGNYGRHAVIPIPFNQPGIATPTHPIHGQQYTYGYTVVDANFNPINLPNGQGPFLATYEGGNTDLRVPYVGYSAESEMYKAIGISSYNALQTHLEKRLSHGFQVGFSYTWSHALDEQSAMGLFYNGNNPLDLHDAYASSDFDRTHVFNFNYVYYLPNFVAGNSWKSKLANGWAVQGIAVIQSGQPYSVIDYSGSVGSIYYGVSDGITNPSFPSLPAARPTMRSPVPRVPAALRRSRPPASPCRSFSPATWVALFLPVTSTRPISLPASAISSGRPGRSTGTFLWSSSPGPQSEFRSGSPLTSST